MEVILFDKFWVKVCIKSIKATFFIKWLLLSDLSPFYEHVDAIDDSFHLSDNHIANRTRKFVDKKTQYFVQTLINSFAMLSVPVHV